MPSIPRTWPSMRRRRVSSCSFVALYPRGSAAIALMIPRGGLPVATGASGPACRAGAASGVAAPGAAPRRSEEVADDGPQEGDEGIAAELAEGGEGTGDGERH